MRDGKEIINRGMTIRTNYLHNHLLPASTVAGYEIKKVTNPEEYIKAVLTEWGSNAIGLRFQEIGYVEDDIPDNLRGLMYCDPNLSKKGKGDTTGIVKISTDGQRIYVSEVYVANTQKPEDLINQINLMFDYNHRVLGFDG